jgi:hypothetical protein
MSSAASAIRAGGMSTPSRRIDRAACWQPATSFAPASAWPSSSVMVGAFFVTSGAAGIGALRPEVWGAFWPEPTGTGALPSWGASTAAPAWFDESWAEPPSGSSTTVSPSVAVGCGSLSSAPS